MDCTTKRLCPCNFPAKNTGVDCHALLQGIFPTQRLNPRFLHLLNWQASSLPLCHLVFPTIWCKSMCSHFLIMLHSQKFLCRPASLLPPPTGFFSLLAFIRCFIYLFSFDVLKSVILDSEYSMSTRFMDTWFRGENLKHHFKEAKNKLSGPKCWLGGKWGGVHEENTQDGSWKRFKAESSSYSSGSSCSKTETRHSTQFPALNASCRGAEPKEAQYTGRSLRLG